MSYADYDFYKNEYYGSLISEADFPRLINKAGDKLENITMDRIITVFDGDNERLITKISKAVCNIADTMYDIEKAEQAYRDSIGYESTSDGSMKGRTISSISAGAESISYTSESVQSSAVSSVVSDKHLQEKLYFDIARDYLSGTGLLYQGL